MLVYTYSSFMLIHQCVHPVFCAFMQDILCFLTRFPMLTVLIFHFFVFHLGFLHMCTFVGFSACANIPYCILSYCSLLLIVTEAFIALGVMTLLLQQFHKTNWMKKRWMDSHGSTWLVARFMFSKTSDCDDAVVQCFLPVAVRSC